MSLRPVAVQLGALLGRPVVFAEDAIGEPRARAVADAGAGGIVLLENLRFHAGEEQNDAGFARALAAGVDAYVDDAFGAAHRAHASTEGIVAHVRDAAAGLLMARELEFLGKALAAPDRPFVAVLGGAKVSGKLEVIENLIGRVDGLAIGGAMAYTFLKARGVPVGRSLVEDDLLDAARNAERRAAERKLQIELPIDHVVAERVDAAAPHETLRIDDAAIGDRIGVDIGPATVERYARLIGSAKTVVWNGPMGVFEIDAFAAGTTGVARAVAAVDGTTIVGGGDSIAAVRKAGVADRISHISTGGGASLEFLGGCTLPGVAVLPDQ
jgi:phosphoglycerate kinase